MIGEETEVDKTISEMIADPLVHLIRNSLDHGIETPEERIASGKSEIGTITIEAKHESGEVWIAIRDDGRGLNKEMIFEKAKQRGLVSGNASNYSDRKNLRPYFRTGFFHCRKRHRNFGTRGSGMDVVKRNIERAPRAGDA